MITRVRSKLHVVVVLVGLVLACPARALGILDLSVIVNTQDPLSVMIGEYYAKRRGLSFQNYIRVSFPPGKPTMEREEFARIKEQVDRLTQRNVQAYPITWAMPYRVDCMSITSAFAFGFDPAFCAEGCKATRTNPYFNATESLPYQRFGMRPTMAVAARSFELAKELIDRGIESDGSLPAGRAYLLTTTDASRNVRSQLYPMAARVVEEKGLKAILRKPEAKGDKKHVLFYFIGRERVEGLETLDFVNGAIADHLTSFGGVLIDSPQMSALRWLEAGATGSYGTVVEPCNLLQKFPHPAVVANHYLQGETLVEAYWKSVLMPGQGIFIGEPLAAPFSRSTSTRKLKQYKALER